jgi:hypothetical protein
MIVLKSSDNWDCLWADKEELAEQVSRQTYPTLHSLVKVSRSRWVLVLLKPDAWFTKPVDCAKVATWLASGGEAGAEC